MRRKYIFWGFSGRKEACLVAIPVLKPQRDIREHYILTTEERILPFCVTYLSLPGNEVCFRFMG